MARAASTTITEPSTKYRFVNQNGTAVNFGQKINYPFPKAQGTRSPSNVYMNEEYVPRFSVASANTIGRGTINLAKSSNSDVPDIMGVPSGGGSHDNYQYADVIDKHMMMSDSSNDGRKSKHIKKRKGKKKTMQDGSGAQTSMHRDNGCC